MKFDKLRSLRFIDTRVFEDSTNLFRQADGSRGSSRIFGRRSPTGEGVPASDMVWGEVPPHGEQRWQEPG